MPRVLLSVVLLALVASGCATTVYQRAPERFDRYVEADVAEYVRWIDRELNLSRDQERRIERMLESRTRHLLANTPVRRHAHVYPFPREKRRHNAAQRRWWQDADRHVGRILSSRQADRYFDLVRDGRYDPGRSGRRYDRHSR